MAKKYIPLVSQNIFKKFSNKIDPTLRNTLIEFGGLLACENIFSNHKKENVFKWYSDKAKIFVLRKSRIKNMTGEKTPFNPMLFVEFEPKDEEKIFWRSIMLFALLKFTERKNKKKMWMCFPLDDFFISIYQADSKIGFRIYRNKKIHDELCKNKHRKKKHES